MSQNLIRTTNLMNYPLSFKNGHIFIEINKQNWLIDTGSPTSFGKNSVSLLEQNFNIAPSFMGTGADYITEHTHVECCGLLGMDILGKFRHLFNLKDNFVTIDTNNIELEGTQVIISSFMSIPTVTLDINKQSHKVFFDTGAQLSYIDSHLLSLGQPNGNFVDFHPFLGAFETETATLSTGLSGTYFDLVFGSLPPLFELTLKSANADGILGNEFMKGNITLFDSIDGVLVVQC